ncbi:succinate dehydrogenase, cytochrome b556 subunit [Methylocella sp.]|uniref:succinate dehydrogenase, cytochrome b556 subunit n=1 Tax=Methylocella sp. TaxID=1978226 RepID=UPI00378449E9
MTEVELKSGRPASRPLSPHLQIYRPTMTMTMSIVHRITGAALYFGMLLLAFVLISAAGGPASFAPAAAFANSILGKLILFGFTWALFHHMLGGVRHLLWDMGWGLDHPQREWLAWGTLIGGIALAALTWICVGLRV